MPPAAEPAWVTWLLGGLCVLVGCGLGVAFIMERRARHLGRENRRLHRALLRRVDELAGHAATRPIAEGLRLYLARRGTGRAGRRRPPS